MVASDLSGDDFRTLNTCWIDISVQSAFQSDLKVGILWFPTTSVNKRLVLARSVEGGFVEAPRLESWSLNPFRQSTYR